MRRNKRTARTGSSTEWASSILHLPAPRIQMTMKTLGDSRCDTTLHWCCGGKENTGDLVHEESIARTKVPGDSQSEHTQYSIDHHQERNL